MCNGLLVVVIGWLMVIDSLFRLMLCIILMFFVFFVLLL